MEIDASARVGDLIRDYPELTDWFMDMGLCGCGHDSNLLWTLEKLAKEKSVDLDVLVNEANERIV